MLLAATRLYTGLLFNYSVHLTDTATLHAPPTVNEMQIAVQQ